MASEGDRRISDVVAREESRLRRFIRRRVRNAGDAEDILQDVLYELVRANRLLMPIDNVAAWLFRVARNRIIDLFRRKATDPLEDVLPATDGGPDATYQRQLLLEALGSAIAELPQEQREVFVAHELEGRSFKEMAEDTGVGVNTLLSRKRYAVLRLRERLRTIHDELMKA